ncbi:retrotransposon hot spot (RHS) protein [Trypanosoma cruzi]|nr:retrotransposon hot spot (RHS) protein [Trypanosoma cruzi]
MDVQGSWRNSRKGLQCAAIRCTAFQADGAHLGQGMAVLVGGTEPIFDCHVNCEVERVWQIVKGDVTELFNSRPEEHFKPHPRVMIGTPGIGKSMNAGSYLIYQLLHYDAEQLQVVFYCLGDTT